jgi:hypothetical protein
MQISGKTSALKKFIARVWRFLISNVGAFVIGFSAMIFAGYQYYVNRPILRYETDTHNVISSQNVNHFKVVIENQSYEDLYQTVVILKNTGQQPLDGDNVSKIGHDPIRILLPKRAETVHFTVDQNLTSPDVSVRLQPYRNAVIVGFDYLNPNDQIAVTVLHRKPDHDFRVVGSALGVTDISPMLSDRQIFHLIMGFFAVLYLLTLLLERLDRKGYL